MDTSSGFIEELAGYRKQLAQPYLVDNQVTDQLILEAYSRLLEEVNVSHILILCATDDLPKDTAAAYKKIADIRREIIANEISFDSAARHKSQDPSARSNNGLLGYFSAFQMIYTFESMAFNTPVGDVSQIFRTQYGYHILKVNGRRKSPGEIKVAHIMIRFNNDNEVAGAKEKIPRVAGAWMGPGIDHTAARGVEDGEGVALHEGVVREVIRKRFGAGHEDLGNRPAGGGTPSSQSRE